MPAWHCADELANSAQTVSLFFEKDIIQNGTYTTTNHYRLVSFTVNFAHVFDEKKSQASIFVQ